MNVLVNLPPIRIAGVILSACLAATSAGATDFDFMNISDLPGGPGSGNHPSINEFGDIAFQSDFSVFIYDRASASFLDLQSLPGAPSEAWFPKLNRAGNVLMIHPSTRELWFFDAATQSFLNLATLPGYPGNSQAHDLSSAFDFNEFDNASLHVGDLNFGDVHFYDHDTQEFSNITDLPGGVGRGRENRINDLGQIAYHGFPDAYMYDPRTGATTNITDLPGGPGSSFGAFSINNAGDLTVFRSDEISFYDASDGSFLYLSTIAGFPASIASTNVNDLSINGGMSFWLDEIYYFDPFELSFTQLTNQGIVPFPGLASSINARDDIAFVAGGDIYLATRVTPTANPSSPRGAAVALRQNHPNPFNPATTIEFELSRDGVKVELRVYDARGSLVRILADEVYPSGTHRVRWDGRTQLGEEAPSAVYFYRLEAGSERFARKMILAR